MKVALINDTSQFNSHFGCALTCQSIREHIARFGMELSVSLPKNFDLQQARELLQNVDLAIINGEGSIHHGRNMHLLAVADYVPSVLINCVYQDNPPSEHLDKLRLVATRESFSQEYFKKDHNCDAIMVPDMIFGSSLLLSYQAERLNDGVGVTDTAGDKNHDFPPHGERPTDYLKRLCSYRTVVTGRYHAAAACAVLGIPFSTWPSNTWKIDGMMHDMSASKHHFKTRQEALEGLCEEFPETVSTYTKTARDKINQLFTLIASKA